MGRFYVREKQLLSRIDGMRRATSVSKKVVELEGGFLEEIYASSNSMGRKLIYHFYKGMVRELFERKMKR